MKIPPRKKRIIKDEALAVLMELLATPGPSGREKPVAARVRKQLIAAGVKPAWIMIDQAPRRIPLDFEMGNLIVKMPGTLKGPRLLFASHLDTVPLCRGAVPLRRGGRIVPEGPTALGADNRSAVACLVMLASTLLKNKLPHPPLTLLFTVGEEIGLWGARHVTQKDLGNPVRGFNYDAGDPNILHTGAIGADRWEVEVQGISAHAGVHPEHGVSAALIASRAIADISRKGYFGKIRKREGSGTSNIGILKGGEATNQVTDHIYIKGESRSHDSAFLAQITGAIREAFERAAASVKNHQGKAGRITFNARREYDAFRIPEDAAVVLQASEAVRRLGGNPQCRITNGGLDANEFNAKGIPTVTLGAGQHNPHTPDEYVDIKEFLAGCELACELAVPSE